jgi:DnaJ like chaperone protein
MSSSKLGNEQPGQEQVSGAHEASPFGQSEQEQLQQKIFVSTFAMLAKLTDIDGTVDKSEIVAIDRFMKTVLKLDSGRRQYAIRVFNESRRAQTSFHEYAVQYRDLLKNQPRMYEWLIDVLLRVSMADEVFSHTEEGLLKTACEVFGINEQRYQQLRSRHVKDQAELNYQLLGCTAQSTSEEIITKYLKMSAEYDPKRIKELGLPEEFIKLAEEKHKAIEDTYQSIKKVRNIQ